jgi:hypothetical protein
MLVLGDFWLLESQLLMALRSYVCPSIAITGSLMRSIVIGHRYSFGTSSLSDAPLPTAAAAAAAAADDDDLLAASLTWLSRSRWRAAFCAMLRI